MSVWLVLTIVAAVCGLFSLGFLAGCWWAASHLDTESTETAEPRHDALRAVGAAFYRAQKAELGTTASADGDRREQV
jgi:hypothetical protein